jgi:hypothetical protein
VRVELEADPEHAEARRPREGDVRAVARPHGERQHEVHQLAALDVGQRERVLGLELLAQGHHMPRVHEAEPVVHHRDAPAAARARVELRGP